MNKSKVLRLKRRAPASVVRSGQQHALPSSQGIRHNPSAHADTPSPPPPAEDQLEAKTTVTSPPHHDARLRHPTGPLRQVRGGQRPAGLSSHRLSRPRALRPNSRHQKNAESVQIRTSLHPGPSSPYGRDSLPSFATSYLSSPLVAEDKAAAATTRAARSARIRRNQAALQASAQRANEKAARAETAKIRSLAFQRLRYAQGVAHTKPDVAADRAFFGTTS